MTGREKRKRARAATRRSAAVVKTRPAEWARMNAVAAHFTEWIGPTHWVIKEKRSELFRVDVHVVAPRPERPYKTMYTAGMSTRRMKVPCQCCPDRLELMITLPADWPLSEPECPCCRDRVKVFRRQKPRLWPVFALQSLARFPHRYATFFDWGHTISAPKYGPEALGQRLSGHGVTDVFDPDRPNTCPERKVQ